MIVARYTQTPDEVKAYKLDYTSWLDTGETIASVSAVTTTVTSPALGVLSGVLASLTDVSVTVSGGVADSDYVVKVTVTTSANQVKEDCLEFEVRAACE